MVNESNKEKLAKRRISRNCILLYCTKICLFYIATHCFVFYFPSRVQWSGLCRSVLTKMPIFFAFIFCSVTYFVSYFVLTHKLSIVFKFWHKGKVLSFYRTFQRFVLFLCTSCEIIFYCQSPYITCILFSVMLTCTRQILPPAAT